MDLDAIETRANNATEGPWESEDHTHGMKGCRCLSCDVTPGWSLSHAQTCDETDQASGAYDGGCAGPVLSFNDAEFCAHARTDVPALVARVRELEEENTRLRRDLKDATAFSAGGYARPFHIEILPSGDWGIYKETWHNDPIETHPDQNAALARARQLKEEK